MSDKVRVLLVSLLAAGLFTGCATVPPRALATRVPEAVATVEVTAKVSDPIEFPLVTTFGQVPSAQVLTNEPTPSPPSESPTAPVPAPTDPTTSPSEPSEPAVDCRKAKCVALTLDDGPVPGTSKVLKLFKEMDVKATFFVLGGNAKAHPELVRRMVRDGHAVGNHSWSHPEFWKSSKRTIRKELAKTNGLLVKLGAAPTLMRPPFGEWDPRVAKTSKSLGLAGILWDVDTLDWKSRNTKKVTKLVLREVRPGSIILTHDTLTTTRKAYPAIIKGLRAKGYTLVTVPELLGARLHAGGRYANAKS